MVVAYYDHTANVEDAFHDLVKNITGDDACDYQQFELLLRGGSRGGSLK